jgi:hypothetical protein
MPQDPHAVEPRRLGSGQASGVPVVQGGRPDVEEDEATSCSTLDRIQVALASGTEALGCKQRFYEVVNDQIPKLSSIPNLL